MESLGENLKACCHWLFQNIFHLCEGKKFRLEITIYFFCIYVIFTDCFVKVCHHSSEYMTSCKINFCRNLPLIFMCIMIQWALWHWILFLVDCFCVSKKYVLSTHCHNNIWGKSAMWSWFLFWAQTITTKNIWIIPQYVFRSTEQLEVPNDQVVRTGEMYFHDLAVMGFEPMNLGQVKLRMRSSTSLKVVLGPKI